MVRNPDGSAKLWIRGGLGRWVFCKSCDRKVSPVIETVGRRKCQVVCTKCRNPLTPVYSGTIAKILPKMRETLQGA